MVESLTSRLEQASLRLLEAVTDGPASLIEFEKLWSTLLADFEKAFHDGCVEEETIQLAHSVQTTVGILARHFLEFHVQADKILSDFHSDLDKIFEEPTATNMIHQTDHSPKQAFEDVTRHKPTFVASAQEWILQNIHNPYPSQVDKVSFLQRDPRSTMHTVQSWFARARQRIGWTSLSRRYYASSQKATVNAAYLALICPDPHNPISPEIQAEFMKVQEAAMEMYSAKSRESTRENNFDMVLKDVAEGDLSLQKETAADASNLNKGEARTRRLQRQKGRNALKRKPTPRTSAQQSYPSPNHSPQASPTFSLLSEGELNSTPQPIAKQIHGALSLDPSSRAGTELHTNLPSPQSIQSPFGSFDCWHIAQPEQLGPQPSINSRKRRLSDSGVQRAPKRPCAAIGPRLQSVSEPLPSTTLPTDVWPQLDFNAPPDVIAGDIEVFNDWPLVSDHNAWQLEQANPRDLSPVPPFDSSWSSQFNSYSQDSFVSLPAPALLGVDVPFIEQSLDADFNSFLNTISFPVDPAASFQPNSLLMDQTPSLFADGSNWNSYANAATLVSDNVPMKSTPTPTEILAQAHQTTISERERKIQALEAQLKALREESALEHHLPHAGLAVGS